MKQFEIPQFYRSPVIGQLKAARKAADPRKRDFSPSLLDFGPLQVLIPRHFGFCYGVENAIEISYRALEENPGKRIFLLSQMIHNPEVNADLESRGIRFIMDTEGRQLLPWDSIGAEDVVITPAFGTTVEIERMLAEKGIATERYNTTCPFVEKVWKRSSKLGEDAYTVIIHGKHRHEETRATFSHSYQQAPSLIIRDMLQAQELGAFIKGERAMADFYTCFEGRYSEGFDPERHLSRIGVVNQTTMLATETQAIADFLKQCMADRYGEAQLHDHFADTRDTLCYATNDNQQATYGMLDAGAHLALVVGGYNSSNTSHIAELCAAKMPTYFIKSAAEVLDHSRIRHFDYGRKELLETTGWLPSQRPLRVALTSGASCPDSVVERVLNRLHQLVAGCSPVEEAVQKALHAY